MRVRYHGHLGKTTGFGRAAEHMCLALDTADVNLDIQPFVSTPGSDHLIVPILSERLQRAAYQGGAADVIIVHDLPLDAVAQCYDGELRRTGTPLIAYTTWEAETVPEGVIDPLMRCFDQIWVPSESNARVFRDAVKLYGLAPGLANNVHVMPHAYDPSALIAREDKAIDAPFRFFWYGAWNVRKNPMGVIRAYAHAFAGTNAHVELVMHSQALTPQQAGAAMAACGIAGGNMPKVSFSNGDKSVAEMLARCDCYVTAAHGEAWNLPAFEASVLAGAQVITPSLLGSDDYLMGSSARFVMGTLAPAQVDVSDVMFADGKITANTRAAQGLTAVSLWRDPDLKELARQMYLAFKHDDRKISFRYNVAKKFGYEAVGHKARALLTNIVTDN